MTDRHLPMAKSCKWLTSQWRGPSYQYEYRHISICLLPSNTDTQITKKNCLLLQRPNKSIIYIPHVVSLNWHSLISTSWRTLFGSGIKCQGIYGTVLTINGYWTCGYNIWLITSHMSGPYRARNQLCLNQIRFCDLPFSYRNLIL